MDGIINMNKEPGEFRTYEANEYHEILERGSVSEFDFNISQASHILEKVCNVLQVVGEIGIDLSSFGKEKIELKVNEIELNKIIELRLALSLAVGERTFGDF